jgi:hypothetical protein
MGADIDCYHGVALDTEHCSQVSFHLDRVDCSSVVGRKTMDFVWTQPRIERILFEDSPSLSSGIFLIPGQFMKLSQNRRVGLKR